MEARQIVEAYRWQRALGNHVVHRPHGRIVTNVANADVWDANHADAVTAETDQEIDAVLRAMERHLSHSNWRVVHTDPFTPDRFLARLALDGYVEQPATIQMALDRELPASNGISIAPVHTEEGWLALSALVHRDHEEGARTGGKRLPPEMTDAIVAGYRAKDGPYRFHLVQVDGRPVAYGAMAAAPSGAGMIEDLFTLPAYRKRGIASAIIGHFTAELRAQGCTCIFLGALVGERARHLYAKLGFRPLLLTRCWVLDVSGRPGGTAAR